MSDNTSSSTNSGAGVDFDQIVVSRDDQGLIVPEEVFIEEFGDTVLARPMNNAAQERYIQPFIEALSAASAVAKEDVDLDELDDDAREELQAMGREALSDEKLADMFEEHIVEPDLVTAYQANYPDREIQGLDEEFVDEELKIGAKDGLFFAILLASDMDELVEALRGTVDGEDDEDEDQGNETGSG